MQAWQANVNHSQENIGAANDAGINHLPQPTHPSSSADAGRQAIASRLVELAQAHGMNTNKNADLAVLLAALQITDPIPIPAFAVVAEVLFSVLNAGSVTERAR